MSDGDELDVPAKGRCLTSNSTAVANKGHDNARGEYILFVNDVIGKPGWNRYQVLDILGHGYAHMCRAALRRSCRCRTARARPRLSCSCVLQPRPHTHAPH